MNKALKFLSQSKAYRLIQHLHSPSCGCNKHKIQPVYSNLKPEDIPFKRSVVKESSPPSVDTLSSLKKSSQEYMKATGDMLALIGCVLAVGYCSYFAYNGIKEFADVNNSQTDVLLNKRP